MYVFGAVDHAAAVARVGRFLGYRVTVCDARARFVTHERFPDVDELVVDWPDRFLAAPVDERTAIVVLTHDHKFDVPLLQVALRTKAGYVGAMGSRTTTEEREAKLRAAGVTDAELARLHAPIGLPIGARTPEEVAVAIAAELVAVARRGPSAPDRGSSSPREARELLRRRRAARGGLGAPDGRAARDPVHARREAARDRRRRELEGADGRQARPDRAHLRHRREAGGDRRGGADRQALGAGARDPRPRRRSGGDRVDA